MMMVRFMHLYDTVHIRSKFLVPQIFLARCQVGVLLSGRVPCCGKTEQREDEHHIQAKSTSRVPVKQI